VFAFLFPVGILGLLIGSFLNVVIHRVPAGASIVSPPSQCPTCEVAILPRDNVPVLGWLLLRGKCRNCRTPISVRYPLVELLTGGAFVVVAWRAAQLDQRAAVPALLAFTALGIALAAIDIDVRRLPDRLVLPAYPVLAALLAGAGVVRHDWSSVARAGLGALALFTFFFALAAASPQGMGFGDVKLAGVIGLVLGYLSWPALLIGAFAGFFLGAVVGVVVLATGAGDRKTAVPFGPFMVAGALLALWITAPVMQLALPS
jgi:leader peptidase (prepilin peptidase)/N-methyltransferase